ncbi:MAG: polysaccharide deacetylase family protein [Rubrobacter sp.]
MARTVALTFDDGPDPDWTPLVLDALVEAGARSTFFVVAPLARSYPSLLARMREAGHEIAFHCTGHVRHDRLTSREIEEDANSGVQTLRTLGHQVRHWRTPWGLVTPATERIARSKGLGLVGWTADTEDWRGGTPETMLDRVEPGLAPGAVLLMHDGLGPGATRPDCAATVALVEPLVSLVLARSLEPVPIGEIPGRLPDRNPDLSFAK